MKNRCYIGIRARFLFIFLASLTVGLLISLQINAFYRDKSTDYTKEITNFRKKCKYICKEIKKSVHNEKEINLSDNNQKNALMNIINNYSSQMDIFIVDNDGNILLKHENNYETQIDIQAIKSMQNKNNFFSKRGKGTAYDAKEIKFYSIEVLDSNRYIVFSQFLTMGDNGLVFIIGLFIFIALFLMLTYGRIKYIRNLSNGLIEISKGNLEHRVDIKGNDEMTLLGKNINYMTQQLKNMKNREAQIEKEKDILIASVSHDLRTPLTSIIGYIKLLQEKYKEEDEIKKYINIIDDKSHRLEELINDLFEYTKLTTCDTKLDKIKISFNEFMRQIVEGIMPLCMDKNLNMILDLPEEEIMISIDPSKMVRVFENILINAIRYSKREGNIYIKVTSSIEGALISIENEGKSLDEEEIHKVFETFYRKDEARSTQTGGMGLGLSIAKSIIDLHGGKIWAEGRNNKVYFNIVIV